MTRGDRAVNWVEEIPEFLWTCRVCPGWNAVVDAGGTPDAMYRVLVEYKPKEVAWKGDRYPTLAEAQKAAIDLLRRKKENGL